MLLLLSLGHAIKYEITHIKQGASLNVRDVPFKKESVVVGQIAFNTTDISIKECSELENGSEWCYISVPRGASHIEGWVNSHYLKEMSTGSLTAKAHIENFLQNFYMAEEENFLDKLKVFYAFPMQQYLWHKNISLRELRSKKVNEYKLWSKRKMHLVYVRILKRRENYIDVQATIRWSFRSQEDYERGKDIQKLRLLPTGDTFKVSALKNLSHTVFPKPVIVPDKQDSNISSELVLNSKKEPAKEPATTPMQFYIKSGSFFSEISPSYLRKISENGFAYSIQKIQQGKRVVRRVYIGPFSSMLKTQEALAVVRKKINKFAYIQSKIR